LSNANKLAAAVIESIDVCSKVSFEGPTLGSLLIEGDEFMMWMHLFTLSDVDFILVRNQ
jgi:hypothetical protein